MLYHLLQVTDRTHQKHLAILHLDMQKYKNSSIDLIILFKVTVVNCSAPNAQLKPTENKGICDTEIKNASAVCPDSVRPLASVIVPLTITGISIFFIIFNFFNGE